MMVIHDCAQGSPEWFALRRGIPTASEFHTVLAKGRDGGASVTRRTYMLKLAGEILTQEPMDSYSNAHMERGKAMEAKARSLYAFMTDAELQTAGFITNGQMGYSPDALVDPVGLAEFKTKLPHLLIELLLKDQFPPEHKAQCQGGLLVSEREWIDITVYWPKLDPFIKRAYRDEPYIRTLDQAVKQFNDELNDMVEQLRRRAA